MALHVPMAELLRAHVLHWALLLRAHVLHWALLLRAHVLHWALLLRATRSPPSPCRSADVGVGSCHGVDHAMV